MKTVRPRIRKIAVCLCVPPLVFLTGCITEKAAARSAKGQLIKEAGEYVSDLRFHGDLPGFTSNERGREIASAPWKGGGVSYPATVTVRAWKQGHDSTYRYTLVKETPASPWLLTAAVRTDNNEKVLEQFLPK